MSIQLNPLVAHLVKNIPEDSAPYVRSQYDKLIAERNTSDVWRQFALWLLIDPDHGVIRFSKPDSKQYQAIQDVADLYDENCKDRELSIRFSTAADAAADAFCAACDAAKSAAADAALAAALAADAAAWAAVYAAAKAADAAYHAAADAARDDAERNVFTAYYAAWAADTVGYSARLSFYNRMAEKLLELLQLAPLKEII